MDQKTRQLAALKYGIYTLLLLGSFLLQEMPGFLSIGPLRPMLVLPLVVVIAMQEGEFAGGLFGMLGGILCDTAAFHLSGLASMLFLLIGTGCGLLAIFWMHANLRSTYLLAAAAAFLYGGISYYLIYGMWGYQGAWRLFFIETIPTALLAGGYGVLFFVPVRRIHSWVAAQTDTES